MHDAKSVGQSTLIVLIWKQSNQQTPNVLKLEF